MRKKTTIDAEVATVEFTWSNVRESERSLDASRAGAANLIAAAYPTTLKLVLIFPTFQESGIFKVMNLTKAIGFAGRGFLLRAFYAIGTRAGAMAKFDCGWGKVRYGMDF